VVLYKQPVNRGQTEGIGWQQVLGHQFSHQDLYFKLGIALAPFEQDPTGFWTQGFVGAFVSAGLMLQGGNWDRFAEAGLAYG
jgi:hypothetical protein